jgi:HK97 family phage major capsid protein
MTENLLEKVITTTTLGQAPDGSGTGLLPPEQAERFIDYTFESTVLGSQVRTIRLRADSQEIDRIGVGERLLRVATEAVDDAVNVGVAFSKVSLGTTKYRLDWELSTESLEDGKEGDALEDHIARMLASQVGNDLEDLAINGDTTKTTDPFLKGVDGWDRRARLGGHIIDHAGGEADRDVFHKAIKAMPRKYMQRRNQLKFFTGANVLQDYTYNLQLKSNDYVLPESVAQSNFNNFDGLGRAFGIPVQEVPLMDETKAGDYSGAAGEHSDVWLTFPKNMIWAIKRDIVVYREFVPRKDAIEYTLFTRIGANIENPDAFVVVKNVKANA